MGLMTKLRHQQPSLWHAGLTKDIEDLWEPWMRLVDRLLEDEQLVDTIYEAQGERYPQSRQRGREQTPAGILCRIVAGEVGLELFPNPLSIGHRESGRKGAVKMRYQPQLKTTSRSK